MTKVKFRKLKHTDKKHMEKLLRQLNDDLKLKLNHKVFQFLIKDKNTHVLIMEHGKEIIGIGTLIIHPVPSVGFVARIEDVVVDEKHRGKGHGQTMTKELIKLAKKKKVKVINLTSNPKRITARYIYEKFGFKVYDTGVYKLEI